MYYAGDIVPIYLSLATDTGDPASVSTPPQVSILDSADNAIDVGGPGIRTTPMTLVPGTDAIYRFSWSPAGNPDGTYLVVVSYVANGLTINGRLLTVVQVGDSRITHEVASAAATARTTDLPNKTEVMLRSDFVAPTADASVQAILAKVVGMPAVLASEATLQTVLALLQDVHDVELGNWVIDKTVSPSRMTLYKVDGSVLHQFDLIRNSNLSSRNGR